MILILFDGTTIETLVIASFVILSLFVGIVCAIWYMQGMFKK